MNATLPKDEIVYLTGLSIDKKRLHKTFKFISKDTDFIDFLKSTNSYLDNIELTEGRKKVGEYYSFIDKKISTATEFFNEFFTLCPFCEALKENIIVDEFFEFLGTKSFSLINKVFKGYIYKEQPKVMKVLSKDILAGNDFIEEFLKKKDILERVRLYEWSDLFSIYLSNQSDSRGVNSLASGDEDSDKCYALNYGYADRPFYENLFVSSVRIEFTENFKKRISTGILTKILDGIKLYSNNEDDGRFLDKKIRVLRKKVFEQRMNSEFLHHALDLLISRSVASKLEERSKQENLIEASSDVLKYLSREQTDQFISSMTNRSIFGIDLLSRCLFASVSFLPASEKLKIFIDHDGGKSDFLEELIEYAGCPDKVVLSSKEDADIWIDMDYQKSDGDLVLSEKTSINGRGKSLYGDFIYFDNTSGEDKTQSVDTGDWILRVPVKLFISLPLIDVGNEEKINSYTERSALLPSRLIHDLKDSGEMNVFTVGGIEHNRPLMRLINSHRQKYKAERIFGYFDNMFDFIHRWENNNKEGFEHYFIMGVNQPVSAFNQVVIQRKDDSSGSSISKAAKQLYFKVRDSYHNIDVNVISIYGFSALSSAYASLYSIAFIKKACEGKFKSKISLAAQALGPSATHAKYKGSTVFLEFTKDIEKDLYEITQGLEYFSYIRLDDGTLINYITSGVQNNGAVYDFVFGRRSTKESQE